MGRLYAISDLHISHKFNLESFNDFFAKPSIATSPASKLYTKDDGLILGGDVTERVADLRHCFEVVTQIFGTVWWVPGNHELYTIPTPSGTVIPDDDSDESIDKNLRGEAKYMKLISVARQYGVHTPEDEYIPFTYDAMTTTTASTITDSSTTTSSSRRLSSNKPARSSMEFHADPRVNSPRSSYSSFLSTLADDKAPDDRLSPTNTTTTLPPNPHHPSSTTPTNRVLVCPIFTLYDYSFRPAHISRASALSWAQEENILATDEVMLHADPYPSRDAWCETLTSRFSAKLAAAAQSHPMPLVLVNHWPLREDLVFIPRVPRFSLWCGTKATDDWHVKFNAACVVTGHLHVRRTDWRDGVRFEEVSMGYPAQWEGVRKINKGIAELVREIMPGPDVPKSKQTETIWRRNG